VGGWDGPYSTLRSDVGDDRGSFQSARAIHTDETRMITVREATRLQGFPDDFKFHPNAWQSFRMIDTVSPFASKAIFSVIAEQMGLRQQFQIAAE
jgi:DNA (cytosine-5)-methyltransferase 1